MLMLMMIKIASTLLMMTLQVIMSVMFFHGTIKEDFDARWKSRHLVKQFMEHKVTRTSVTVTHTW